MNSFKFRWIYFHGFNSSTNFVWLVALNDNGGESRSFTNSWETSDAVMNSREVRPPA